MMVLGAPESFCSCHGDRRLLLRRPGPRLDPKVCDGEHQCCHEEHAADSPSRCREVGELRNTRQIDRCDREEEQCYDGALPCCGWSVRYRWHACASFPVASWHRSGTARRRRRLCGRPRQGCAEAQKLGRDREDRDRCRATGVLCCSTWMLRRRRCEVVAPRRSPLDDPDHASLYGPAHVPPCPAIAGIRHKILEIDWIRSTARTVPVHHESRKW